MAKTVSRPSLPIVLDEGGTAFVGAGGALCTEWGGGPVGCTEQRALEGSDGGRGVGPALDYWNDELP